MKKLFLALILLHLTIGFAAAQSIFIEVRSNPATENSADLFDTLLYRGITRHNSFTISNNQQYADFNLKTYVVENVSNSDRKMGYSIFTVLTFFSPGKAKGGFVPEYFVDSTWAIGGPEDLPRLKNDIIDWLDDVTAVYSDWCDTFR